MEYTLAEQRGSNTWEIADIPSNSRIVQTFNVDQLRHSHIDHSRPQPAPPPIRVITRSGSTPIIVYEVEKILDWRQNEKGSVEFLVKWMGLTADKESTWEKQHAFTGAKEILSKFILQPENAELAHLLHWPRNPIAKKNITCGLKRKSRAKGAEPSRRSSRIQQRNSPTGNVDDRKFIATGLSS